MKRNIFKISSAIIVLLFLSNVSFSQHHGAMQKKDTTQTSKSMKMMHMKAPGMMGQQRMQQEKGMMMHQRMQDMSGKHMMGMHDRLFAQLCHYGCPGFLLELKDKLDISDDQMSELQRIKNNFQKTVVRKQADLKIHRIEITELLNQAKPDFKQIRSKMTDMATIEKELRSGFLDSVEKSRNVLNQNQLESLLRYTRDHEGCMMTPGGMMK